MTRADGSKLPRGSRGGRTSVTTKEGRFNVNDKDQHFKPDELVDGPLATVGIAASVGQSTEYGQEKYEISAWCSMPVPADEDGIKDGYDVAYDFVMKELETRHLDVQRRFFPHLVKKKEG